MDQSLEREIRGLYSCFHSSDDPQGRSFVPLADAYRRAGDLQRARLLLEEGLRRHPDFSSAHVVAMRIARDVSDHAGALAATRRVLELDPGNLEAQRVLAAVGPLATDARDPSSSVSGDEGDAGLPDESWMVGDAGVWGAGTDSGLASVDPVAIEAEEEQAPPEDVEAEPAAAVEVEEAPAAAAEAEEEPAATLEVGAEPKVTEQPDDEPPDSVEVDEEASASAGESEGEAAAAVESEEESAAAVEIEEARPAVEAAEEELPAAAEVEVEPTAGEALDKEPVATVEVEAEPAAAEEEPAAAVAEPSAAVTAEVEWSVAEEPDDEPLVSVEAAEEEPLAAAEVEEEPAPAVVEAREEPPLSAEHEEEPAGTPSDDPDAGIFTRTLGRLYEQQGLPAQAIAVYERLLKSEPGDEALAQRLDRLRRPTRGEAAGEAPEETEVHRGDGIPETAHVAPEPHDALPVVPIESLAPDPPIAGALEEAP